MTAPASVQLTGNDLTFAQLYDVALHGAKVSLAPDAIAAHESLPRRRRARRLQRRDRLRHQHRLRQARFRPHLHRTSPPAPGQSRSLARLRCRRSAQRSRNPRDDASPRQRARQRTQRHPPRNRRSPLRNAQRQSSSRHSVARFRRRIRRPRATRASRARRHRRRPRPHRRKCRKKRR